MPSRGHRLSGLICLAAISSIVFSPDLSFASAVAAPEYGSLFGLDSRKVVWFFAQVHLFFAAFALGVPFFAVIIEASGHIKKDEALDRLAREFAGLLGNAFVLTALFGALLAFALFHLYPKVMVTMIGVFRPLMLVYAALFFIETLALGIYFYGWDRLDGTTAFAPVVRTVFKVTGITLAALALILSFSGLFPEMRGDTRLFISLAYLLPLASGLFFLKDRKGLHILSGIVLIVAGTAIMQSANSWVAFMMSPAGVDKRAMLTGGLWQAIDNPLATPLAVHRILGNLTFGGLVAGAYAAVKFLSSKNERDKAYYDWMGYVSNLVAVAGLIPLPLAGYYLGREIYSFSPLMGNNMMGGEFSWTFIIQALLVGSVFVISNYYLWLGMSRMPGALRYEGYIKYILAALAIALAVWITPHNLPLSQSDVAAMGGRSSHPMLKMMGLMPAKNAVINMVILSTFFSFLIYRRGNREGAVSVGSQGLAPRVAISLAALFSLLIVGLYALRVLKLDPEMLNMPEEAASYFRTAAAVMFIHCLSSALTAFLALMDRGVFAQAFHLVITALNVVVVMGALGFAVMETASSFMRHIAAAQFLQVISAMLLAGVIDFYLYRGGKSSGPYRWGRVNAKSQYALLLLTVIITLTMGLMGYVRSGLRMDWHIYGILRDTSQLAYTPDHGTMAEMVALTALFFFLFLALVFRLGERSKGGKGHVNKEDESV